MYLMPPYGVMMAVVFLGEELHAYHFGLRADHEAGWC
ncbi:MAG: hypothetical protein HPM95_18665 [Alphaproteobacteria bacterium]|nr:hypothetical protein [Alphaproteobacteria bacterium]